MTRNTPRTAVARVLMVLIPALLVATVAFGLVAATRATGASAGETPSGPATSAAAANPGSPAGGVGSAAGGGGSPAGGAGSPADGVANPGSPAGGAADAGGPVEGGPASASGSATSGAPGGSATANSDCLTDDLTGTVIGQPRGSNPSVRDAVLRLTNTSGRTCRVKGWPDIAMVTPPGELVQVPTRKIEQTAGNPEIILTPQASAWSRIQWDTCAAGRKGCGVGVALQYIVDPDSTGTVADLSAVPEADQAGITMKALRVSPLQRTRTAALS